MAGENTVVRTRDLLLALALGTEALFAMVPPWCGLGWGAWVVCLVCASTGFALAMRFLWSG
jgi:hypothetical protein